MIVVDTNVLACLFIKSPHGPAVEKVYRADPDWAAPLLWRSEFRNVLVKTVRAGILAMDDAAAIAREAERLLIDAEYAVLTEEVVRLAIEKGCSAYDAEFVALARDLGVRFVTLDAALPKLFPQTAVSAEKFVG